MKRMRGWIRQSAVAAAVVISFCSTLPAQGQYTNPYTGRSFNNPASSFLDTVILNNQRMQNLMVTQMVNRSMLQQSLSRQGLRLDKKQRAAADRFAKYRGTMYKTAKPVMPTRLAAMFIKQPGKQRDDMTKLFEVLLDVYNKRSKQQNAPPTDFARTLTYCIAANYAYFTEQEVSAKGMDVLRGKIRMALTSDAKFRAMSDADKQKVSETLIILTHFTALGYDESKERKNEDAMKGFKKLAGYNLQGMLGVAPQNVRLEKTGLVVQK